MRHAKVSLIQVVLLLVSAFPLTAVARDYDLELIVFERFAKSGEVKEQWLGDSNGQLRHRQDLASMSGRATSLPAGGDVNRLAGVKSGLQKSGYRLLESVRWRQPARVYKSAPIYRLASNDGRMKGYLRIYKTSLIFADLLLSLKGELPVKLNRSTSQTTDATAQSGIGISSINLANTSTAPTLKPVVAPDYFIKQKRQLKFKEVHYFDHPKYGAILTVWPTDG